ncbi:hypothetical protein [Streptomyces endophyticus]|uniref:MFS transporter n=1 Tax=Streptomyces endophyticus TaxID=714166 RepID=A0ABU6FBU1_9ACTN|nr:hypothetical protein [Streptomyces endophyticus]MEB8340291.1 hypothetical protein [Streptomyces endophyticus]
MFVMVTAVRFLSWATASLFLAVVPAVLAISGQSDPAVVIGVPLSVLVCSALAQPLAAELGGRCAQFAGLTALLVSLSVLSLTAGTSTWATPVAAVFAGFGHGLGRAGASAAVGVRTPSAAYLGLGLPALTTALLAPASSPATATALVASALALLVFPATGAVLEVGRTARRPGQHLPHPIHWIDPKPLCGRPTRSTPQF